MKKFEELETIVDGASGTVFKAKNLKIRGNYCN
jgi:hypothetical protein